MKRWLALALLLAVPAYGAPAGYRLYADGKYDEAIKAGLAENDAAGFGAAARAALAEAASLGRPCLECLNNAESYARRAIAADPKFPDGQVYLAVALGLKEHIVGPLTARLHNYPSEAKGALDAALAADPNNAWTLAALGGWNIAIVHHAGGSLADWIYGATVKQGLADFAASFKAAPDNIVIRYQYALSLSDYDADRYRDQIEAALEQTVSGKADTVYGKLLQARAAELLALLKAGDGDAYAARVKTYLGYP
ncbi:MAG: hypothetical protein KGJ79_10590 [Alphaproteobacteria bacterium]|nr:hypothetical protein [Alphaproteobacteria bacterium]MDE2111578.1 hypothetical protein [Alphaproteobacteria bacterium]MDE2493483.1 hypothetical protein [Alphaproteobacteria bacterium]